MVRKETQPRKTQPRKVQPRSVESQRLVEKYPFLMPFAAGAATVGLAVGAYVLGQESNDSDSNPTRETSTTTLVVPTTEARPDGPERSNPTVDTGVMPEPVNVHVQGQWEVSEFKNLKDNPIVEGWLNRLKDPAPELWQTFPNVPNPQVSEFRVVNGTQVPDGVEYGVADSPFCEQDQRCDWVVPAQSYRLISGDYKFLGDACKGKEDHGCLIVLVNVGNETYTWRNQSVDNGFTVHGRYWNGDALEMGVWGLVSHASANMLNMPTSAHPGESLNFGEGTNAGANCGKAEACKKVEATVVVHAGSEILAMARTTVAR